MYTVEVPETLIEFVGQDKTLNITKDGLHDWEGKRAFRCLVTMEWDNSNADISRMDRLDRCLTRLKRSNEIIAYRKI